MAHSHASISSGLTLRLMATMALNFIITVAEIIGGLLAGSLSLISDALHNFSDGVSVLLSYFAIKLKQRDYSSRHTFGFKRSEIFAAAINATVLVGISCYLFYEAVHRFLHPQPIKGLLMISVAVVGLAANVVGTWLLHRDASRSINIRSAYLHLLTDALSSLGVLTGGVLIYFWNIYWVDPLLTIVIGVYIIIESFQILSQSVHILMEGAPPDIEIEKLRKIVEAFPEVRNIHHVHLWMVGENDVHLEAHVNVQDMLVSQSDDLRKRMEERLTAELGIRHITLQFECDQCPEEGLIKKGIE